MLRQGVLVNRKILRFLTKWREPNNRASQTDRKLTGYRLGLLSLVTKGTEALTCRARMQTATFAEWITNRHE